MKTAPGTGRETASGISRKQSVLSALRERQNRMKEQKRPEQKEPARRKGEQEL